MQRRNNLDLRGEGCMPVGYYPTFTSGPLPLPRERLNSPERMPCQGKWGTGSLMEPSGFPDEVQDIQTRLLLVFKLCFFWFWNSFSKSCRCIWEIWRISISHDVYWCPSRKTQSPAEETQTAGHLSHILTTSSVQADTGEGNYLSVAGHGPPTAGPWTAGSGKTRNQTGSDILSPEPFNFPNHIFMWFQAWRINFKAQLKVQSAYFTLSENFRDTI